MCGSLRYDALSGSDAIRGTALCREAKVPVAPSLVPEANLENLVERSARGRGRHVLYGRRQTMRIRTWGVVCCSINSATIVRLAGTSVMWVIVQLAGPTIAASSKTAESLSPHSSTLSCESS